MLNNIHSMLEHLGLSLQKRALHIQFSNEALNSQVFVQRIQGQHFINQGLKAEVLCLSTNAHIQLKQFIGCQVAIDQVTDMGKLARTTGIVTGVSQGQSDGALTLYNSPLKMRHPCGISAVIAVYLCLKAWLILLKLFFRNGSRKVRYLVQA